MPTAPSDLTATSSSSSQIDLAWTNNDTYDAVEVWRKAGAGSYSMIEQVAGNSTSYNDTTISTNIRYYYRVYSVIEEPYWRSVSNTNSAASWDDAFAETLTWSDDVRFGVVVTQSTTETITWTDFHAASQTLKTNYGYYYGSSDGKIYEYSADSQSDAGTNILAYWQSKRLDFADQYVEDIDRFKTVYKVQLKYVDLTADTPITVYVSGDGGVTWEYQYRTIGSGDEKTKTADFHFMLNAEMFTIKVESSSTDKKFQLLGIYVYYSPCGEYFEI